MRELKIGDVVKLNVSNILEHEDELSEVYVDWINQNKDETFYVKSKTDSMFCRLVDKNQNDIFWIFHEYDLTLVIN